jgi:PTS system galactitol-specific IIB component
MKKLIVACGSGVATSQTVASKLKRLFEKDNLDVDVEAVDYKSIRTYLATTDVYVYIAKPDSDVLDLAKKHNVQVFSGIPFLTGMNMGAEYKKIEEALGS